MIKWPFVLVFGVAGALPGYMDQGGFYGGGQTGYNNQPIGAPYRPVHGGYDNGSPDFYANNELAESGRYHHREKPGRPQKPYAFSYGVDGNRHGGSFGQQEKSDGTNVKGSYIVNLPDGRKQVVAIMKYSEAVISGPTALRGSKVSYTAGKKGFEADVKYEGKASYPKQKKKKPREDPYYDEENEVEPLPYNNYNSPSYYNSQEKPFSQPQMNLYTNPTAPQGFQVNNPRQDYHQNPVYQPSQQYNQQNHQQPYRYRNLEPAEHFNTFQGVPAQKEEEDEDQDDFSFADYPDERRPDTAENRKNTEYDDYEEDDDEDGLYQAKETRHPFNAQNQNKQPYDYYDFSKQQKQPGVVDRDYMESRVDKTEADPEYPSYDYKADLSKQPGVPDRDYMESRVDKTEADPEYPSYDYKADLSKQPGVPDRDYMESRVDETEADPEYPSYDYKDDFSKQQKQPAAGDHDYMESRVEEREADPEYPSYDYKDDTEEPFFPGSKIEPEESEHEPKYYSERDNEDEDEDDDDDRRLIPAESERERTFDNNENDDNNEKTGYIADKIGDYQDYGVTF